jgi:putative phosphoribosyl transferase
LLNFLGKIVITKFTYSDRSHAGKVLAENLLQRKLDDPVILALPRGGVPVAHEIAEALHLPMDVLIARKIGAPFNPEYGIGAISEDLNPVFNAGELLSLEDLEDEVKVVIEKEKVELKRRVILYRGTRRLPDLTNRTVVLVDDGLATGVTAAAASRYLKMKGAKEIILAVPVGPRTVSDLLERDIDEVICPYRPANFTAIGLWYQQFNQVSDHEVLSILRHYHPEAEVDLSL